MLSFWFNWLRAEFELLALGISDLVWMMMWRHSIWFLEARKLWFGPQRFDRGATGQNHPRTQNPLLPGIPGIETTHGRCCKKCRLPAKTPWHSMPGLNAAFPKHPGAQRYGAACHHSVTITVVTERQKRTNQFCSQKIQHVGRKSS